MDTAIAECLLMKIRHGEQTPDRAHSSLIWQVNIPGECAMPEMNAIRTIVGKVQATLL